MTSTPIQRMKHPPSGFTPHMKTPKNIKAGSHTYSIIISKTRDDAKGSGNWGKTNLGTGKIYLDDTIMDTKREEVLLHELIHVAFHNVGLHQQYDDKQEEDIVDRIAKGLYPILKDNKLTF